MKYLLCILCMLVLPSSVLANSEEIAKLKSWKQTLEDQKKQFEGELGLWKLRICNTTLVSAGKSPVGGFTHVVPGQDPTNVGAWRDPMTKGDAEDNFIEAKSQVERLEDAIKMTEKELSATNKKIDDLERIENGGGGSGGGGGSSGGGGGGGGY